MLKQKKLSFPASRIQRRLLVEFWTLIQPVIEIEGIKIFTDHNLSSWMRVVLRSTAFHEQEEQISKYEEEELQIVKSQLSQNDIVMEIGAGIGLISTYCANLIGSERVFTYEANPVMERYIRNTYKLNHVSPTLEICLIGLQNGQETFYVADSFWASSTIQKSSKAKAVIVPMKSFNQEVQRINPTFLIIDIEGGEYELLQDANFNNDVKKVVIETHEHLIGQDKINSLKSKFAQAGFELNKNFSRGEVLFFQRS